MKMIKEIGLLKHFKYNREVVYEGRVEMTAVELKKIVEENFNEKDKEYLYYHNPTIKFVKGEKIHACAKLEQLLKERNFYIELK